MYSHDAVLKLIHGGYYYTRNVSLKCKKRPYTYLKFRGKKFGSWIYPSSNKANRVEYKTIVSGVSTISEQLALPCIRIHPHG